LAIPRVGPFSAGVLALLAGFPVLAQVGAFPSGEPARGESIPPAETETAPTASPQSPEAPAEPASPFGISPDVFPGIFGGRPAQGGAPAEPASPFGISPDIFPGILGGRPDRRAQEQPVAPSETGEPDVFQMPGAERLEAAPAPEAPLGPEPGLAAPPELVPPAFITPPFGFGDAVTAPYLPPNAAPATGASGTGVSNPLSTTRLAPLRPGALPVQAYDPRAPWILIRPTASLSVGYTDNPHSAPQGFSDEFARLRGGTAISVDTVRLQGQFNGTLDYQKFVRASDQDRLNVNLLAYGLGTVVQDHVFVDTRAAITQVSRTGGLGFAGPQVIQRSQDTQVMTASLSPVARNSFGGYVDSELRYNYGLVRSQPGGFFGNGNAPAANNLQDATSNAVTGTLATGRLFTYFGSKLTLSARKVDSDSASRSTQLRAFDDLEYQFNQKFAALGRFGFEKLDYPLQPAASFTGPSWSVGGRYTPFPGAYFIGNYGRQEGQTGFSGALRYEITPMTVALASFARNRGTQQEQILNNLNASAANASGNLVDQSGLPLALVNPQFALSNAVFNFETARVGLQSHIDRNAFGIFGFFQKRSQLGQPLPAAAGAVGGGGSTSEGINFSWGRSLTPRLNSSATLGYARESANSDKTLTASLSMTYELGERLRAILHYQFINVDSAAVGSSYQRNQVEIGLTRSF
jgi:uncharacterized protein (PEP-CTERM system associated)